MFNFDRAFFSKQTTRMICSAKRSIQDRQRDVYDSHRHRIFALAYYMLGNEIVAEETLERTFVGAFQAAEEPDAKAIDAELMGQLRARITFDKPVSPVEVLPENSGGMRNIRRTDLEEAIGELPELERLIFLLKDVEGYAMQAISDFSGVDAAEVPRILMSARLRLRAILASGAVPSTSPIHSADKSTTASEAA